MVTPVDDTRTTVVGLFAGIGGLDIGFEEHPRFRTTLFCDDWQPARTVLESRFPDVPIHRDIRDLEVLPDTDVLTAGFPCTDLSQVGRTGGINGRESGLIRRVLDLVDANPPRWLVLENVRNMLVLHKGEAMRLITSRLEGAGFAWAYRVVDSRFTGVPQRRERVILLASRTGDPAGALLAPDAGLPDAVSWRNDACGFHWTEGNRGIGWVPDGVPTLKGGSGLGVPSPPGIWLPENDSGRRIARPSIEDVEVLQGFDRGWTDMVDERRRWKLVGNAVTAGISRWLAARLADAAEADDALPGKPLDDHAPWPRAGFGHGGKRWKAAATLWPEQFPYRHLTDLLDRERLEPLSYRATKGFRDRLAASSLRYDHGFMAALDEHVALMHSDG